MMTAQKFDEELLDVFPIVTCRTREQGYGFEVSVNGKQIKTINSCDISFKTGECTKVTMTFDALVNIEA